MWSCRLLGRRRQKEDEPFFLARLQDEEASVRQNALVGMSMLAQRYDMKQLLPVVEPLLQDEDKKVRIAAIGALEALGTSAKADGKE
jgi:HEAT repeat protein